MTERAILGAPKFKIRTIRFPEDEVSLYVKWTQFHLIYAANERASVVAREMDAALVWCTDQFGPVDPMTQRWMIRRAMICIRSDSDSTAFRLRWC